MEYYLRIYKKLLALNFSAVVEYRANLVNSVIGNFIWGIFHFVSITLLTSQTKQILGWKREEVILLTAGFSIFWGIFHIVLGKNFQRMSRLMDRGQLDSILLKPIDSQFLISLSLTNYPAIIRVLIGIIGVWYLTIVYHLNITFLSLLGSSLLFLCGYILVYSIWFIILTLTVWFAGLSNLIDLLFHISGIMRYPPDIFRTLNEFIILLLLPLLLVNSTPIKFLLNKGNFTEIGYLAGFTIIFFFISRKFWKYALRHYTSASG